ncbi:MAG TPA: hypothetical protein P5119_13425 [Candidatus Aminicenantes bacterium]|nr:hypothetical protein [Candidatus Aminicenantes bacterium]HRY66326.1 hypothetical protein [Candidatus Aminicenantes bacterium]HRZ73227.1 hypothetical protein [Candidatus Aminicenantes bacterium]
MNTKRQVRAAVILIAAISFLTAGGIAAQSGQAPPEYKEVVAAYQMTDPTARLRELERLKAAYPGSQLMEAIDAGIQESKAALATDLDDLLALQRAFLAGAQGPSRMQRPVAMAAQLINHPRVETFDHTGVLEIILAYRGAALKAAADPAAYEGIADEHKEPFKANIVNAIDLLTARAYLGAGDLDKASVSIEAYRKGGGATGGNYYYVLAGILESQGRTAEALDAYLSAAVDGFADSAVKARAVYGRVHGSEEGFAAALEARLKSLPFKPAPFEAPAGWKGKTVLAELFTGSECPPCVAADVAFDGLAETIPSKYLAVLVYHLPIPRPDPMINPASTLRAGAYGIGSTPTIIIDGTGKSVGGGNRGAAEGKYKQFRSAIEPLLAQAPALTLKARALMAGDKVAVTYDLDRVLPDVEHVLVLVQDEQEHSGGNGVKFHRMVVRDLVVLDPAGPKGVAFDLAESEKKTDAFLTEFEKSYTRSPGFKWAVRRQAISRTGLRVVLFAQEKSSGKVLNAVVAPVE